MIDSMVALGALAIGLVLIFSMHEYNPPTGQPSQVAEEVLNTLLYNKIKNINNYYGGPNSILTRDGNITDINKPLLEQVGEFYYRNVSKNCGFCLDLIDSFLQNMTEGLIPPEYNYIIRLENNTVYNHSHMPSSQAKFVIPARAIVHGLYNKTELYGPYIAEVLTWG